MNDLTLENVSGLIAAIGNGVKKPHTLFFADGSLQLISTFKHAPPKDIITVLSVSEIRNGLTSKRWNLIESRLRMINEVKT